MSEIRQFLGRYRLRLGALCTVAGLLAIVGGYVGVSGTSVTTDQLSYLMSGGLGGIALVIIGTGLLVVDYFTRLEQAIATAVTAGGAGHAAATEPRSDGAPRSDGQEIHEVVVVSGARRFHLPGCTTLARHQDASTMLVTKAVSEHLTPCSLCVDVARLPRQLERL